VLRSPTGPRPTGTAALRATANVDKSRVVASRLCGSLSDGRPGWEPTVVDVPSVAEDAATGFDGAGRVGTSRERPTAGRAGVPESTEESSPAAAYLTAMLTLRESVAGQMQAVERTFAEQVEAVQKDAAARLPNTWTNVPGVSLEDPSAVAHSYSFIAALQHAHVVASHGYALALQQYLTDAQRIRESAQEATFMAQARMMDQWVDAGPSDPPPAQTSHRAGHRIRNGDFVSHLVRDPSNPPPTIMLFGYPGEAATEGHTRFYLDPMLSTYVDVPDDKILGIADSSISHSPLAGCHVWVEKEPELVAMIQDSVGKAMVAGQELWNRPMVHGGGLPLASPGQFAGVAVPESPVGATDDLDDEDVPLPPGWPLAAS
jgi:hypothetical protein